MNDWLTPFVLVFLVMCVGMLAAVAARIVRSLERAARAVERLAAATRLPEEG